MKGEDAPKSPIFEEIIAVHSLHLAPKYLGNITAGIKEHLCGLLLKYNEDLKAVPLVFTKADPTLSPVAPIMYDNPCVHVQVRVRWIALSPNPGARIKAHVSLQSQEHLGLLLLDFFNVTIPANQLSSVYRWDSEHKCWVNKRSGEQVYLGDAIEFEILNFSNEGGVLVINGSVDKLFEVIQATSSPAKTPKAKAAQAPSKQWHVESIPDSEDVSPKKKRKHEEKDADKKDKKKKDKKSKAHH